MTRARGTCFALALALLSGCPDEPRIAHNRIPKAAPVANAPPTLAADPDPMNRPSAVPPEAPAAPPPPGMAGEVPAPPKPTGDSPVVWTLPQGWTQTLTGGIRFATLTAAQSAALEISIVVLAGPAGGELANVNRWRSQIGLSPLQEDSLGSAKRTLSTKLGAVSLYDFTGEGSHKSRIVVALATGGDDTWFFKMTGDADAVAKALPDFTKLIQSLRPGPAGG